MTPWFGRAAAVLLRVVLGCPCGADPYAPVDEHDASFTGRHVLEDGCACRCGDQRLEPWPLDRDGGCEHRDVECEAPDGDVTPLVCE